MQPDTVSLEHVLGLKRGAQVILKRGSTRPSSIDLGPMRRLAATGYLARMLRWRLLAAGFWPSSMEALSSWMRHAWWRRGARVDMLSGRGASDVLIAPSDFHARSDLQRVARSAVTRGSIRLWLDRFAAGRLRPTHREVSVMVVRAAD
jgi:hypothetical protein